MRIRALYVYNMNTPAPTYQTRILEGREFLSVCMLALFRESSEDLKRFGAPRLVTIDIVAFDDEDDTRQVSLPLAEGSL